MVAKAVDFQLGNSDGIEFCTKAFLGERERRGENLIEPRGWRRWGNCHLLCKIRDQNC